MSSFQQQTFAIVGATGNVGRTILSILSDVGVPPSQIFPVASQRSAGAKISYGEDHVLSVKGLDNFDFSKAKISFFAPGSAISKIHAPKAATQGSLVIDKTSCFRMDPDVPLIVPEVNAHQIKQRPLKGIIANPNCTTIPLMVVLNVLNKLSSVKRVVISTYQSVSGAGKAGMDELFNQTRGTYMQQDVKPDVFHKPIAFNVIPQIDDFDEHGDTKEELKMRFESQKILEKPLLLSATCVRVPVFIGHSMSVNIEFEEAITPGQARAALKAQKSIRIMDRTDDMEYITPIEVSGEDSVYVSRIRKDPTLHHGLNLWIACDNLRKGAALNAVQIAHCLVKNGLLS